MKVLRRVEKDLAAAYPSAQVTSRAIFMVAAVGRDMGGLSVLHRGLTALRGSGLEAIGATQRPRQVDVQFIVDRSIRQAAICALHAALVAGDSVRVPQAA